MILQNRDFVIVGLQPWYTAIGSNCKNIARQFSRHNRVLYINIPLNRNVLFHQSKFPELKYHFDVLANKEPGLTNIDKNFWNYYPAKVHESINWMSFPKAFNFFNKINNQRFARDIRQAVTSLGFSNIILFNDNDIFRAFYLKELLQPDLYIYYCRDYLRGVDYFKKHADRLEPEHIAKADIAMANSTYLTSYLRQYNSNAHYIGQGCDVELFNVNKSYKTPDDIKDIPAPRIGYVGALTTMRLDIPALLYIAQTKPEWQLILAGPEDENFKKSELHHLVNVHFLGKKDLALLPPYIQAFDVCINPQVVNPLTIGNYPLKVDEYLAMGKPVIATETKAMELFRPYCYLAKKAEEYVPLVEKALQETDIFLREKRIAFATSHTWENCVNEIYRIINKKSVDEILVPSLN